MGRINRTKLLDRQHDRRNAKLFIIATEGRHTESQYFHTFHSTKIKVEVLSTGEDCRSAPQYVLDRLNEFKERYDLGAEDELWLVTDVDRWGRDNLSSVCREAKQKDYGLAISNPCFEVWLCLHLQDLDPNDKTSQQFKSRLREILGSHNASNLDLEKFKHKINEAMARSKSLHQESQQHWPNQIGTHVHQLVESILNNL